MISLETGLNKMIVEVSPWADAGATIDLLKRDGGNDMIGLRVRSQDRRECVFVFLDEERAKAVVELLAEWLDSRLGTAPSVDMAANPDETVV
jgi:hypothetical protein